jgi:hypothetical protein
LRSNLPYVLVGSELLFKVSGISSKVAEADEAIQAESATAESFHVLIGVLGIERYDRVLAVLHIVHQDGLRHQDALRTRQLRVCLSESTMASDSQYEDGEEIFTRTTHFTYSLFHESTFTRTSCTLIQGHFPAILLGLFKLEVDFILFSIAAGFGDELC